MASSVLVAGIGNIFFGDDGFGPEVVRRLADDPEPLPRDVRVVDYGIRGMHLAFDLLDGVDVLVLVDAIPGTGNTGTGDAGAIEVLQVDRENLAEAQLDAHGMSPASVLGNVEALGGALPATYVVGCVPEDMSEGIGLSPVVAAAVQEAAATVRHLIAERVPTTTAANAEPTTGGT